MAATTTVVFTKRVEDRDKKGNKIVIPAGTKSELSNEELARVKHAVRIVQPETGPEEQEETDSGDGASGD